MSQRNERPIPAPSDDTSLTLCGPACISTLNSYRSPLLSRSALSMSASFVFLKYDELIGTPGPLHVQDSFWNTLPPAQKSLHS